MQRSQGLSVIAAVLLFAAVIANHAFARLPLAPLYQLPIDTFPRVVGEWISGPDIPADAEVFKKLLTARIVDRNYTRPGGPRIETLLLTASSYSDFHDPNWCFPSQGFHLSPVRTLNIGGQSARSMTAERDGQRLRVLYWWQGHATTELGYGRDLVRRLLTLRDRLTNEQGQTLFVRLTMADAPNSEKVLQSFAMQQIIPHATLLFRSRQRSTS